MPSSILDSSLPAVSSSLSLSVNNALSTMEATAVATIEKAGKGDTSIILLFFKLIFAILKLVPRIMFWVITFSTMTLPTWLFTIFSTSLTVTMNATTVLMVTLVVVSIVSWIVRYRFLDMYSRLPPEPQRKEPQIELFPDTQEGDSKPGLATYLDEFLSAIKVFGYLERPVFHELTRTMQTRKLIAGETLLLEEEKGFCLVVDGLVQIFVKSNLKNNDLDSMPGAGNVFDEGGEQYESGQQGYQLLTEVKNGAPMSSLFSILSLFTEDVKLRLSEEDHSSNSSSFEMANMPPTSGPASPKIPLSPNRTFSNRRFSYTSAHGTLPAVPPMYLDPKEEKQDEETVNQEGKKLPRQRPKKPKSVHPDIVARAMVDTTIAVIPATAFHRVTRVYPKATAHIVQVILTRLQRVTFATAHTYLGLTSEVLRTEKLMDQFTTYDLPNHLRGDALERLKDKFRKEKDRIGSEEGMKGIALHNPNANRRRSSATMRKEAAIHAKMKAARLKLSMARMDNTSATADRSAVSPGDLLSNIQLSRYASRASPPTLSGITMPHPQMSEQKNIITPLTSTENQGFVPPNRGSMQQIRRQNSIDEDTAFRESVLNCISKAIGLGNAQDAIRRPVSSVEQSPRLVSYDSRRQKAVFSNAFGFMDPLESSADGETESITSTSNFSLVGSSYGLSLSDEVKGDIEIVFFPKGSVLVEQGERNPGLYYVIDGFLDVSIPSNEKASDSSDREKLAQNYSRDELAPPSFHSTASSVSSSYGGPLGQEQKKHSRKTVYLIKPGGVAGYVGSISSYRSFTDVRAKTDVYVGFLPRASLERMVDKYPVILLTMAKRLTSLLPRLLLHIDFALEWIQVNAGEVIHHQGDESDAIYIVLNGRLRAVMEKGGDMRAVGEFGQGESVGELEVLTESTRPATLHAIRESELTKFPKTLFNSLALENPGITIQISKIIARRMRSLIEDPVRETLRESDGSLSTTVKNASSTLNLRTIAILPITAGVPVVEFGGRLLNALTQIGVVNGVTSLNQAVILSHMGRHAFSKMGKLKLSQYLTDLEEKYGMVLYIADTNVNAPWTQTCIAQADCILLVGLAEASPSVGEYERFLLGQKTTARKELVLLHVERYSPPGLTRKWLRNREWINGGHHHIQMAFRTTPEPAHPQINRLGIAIKQRVQVLQAEIQKYTSRRVRQMPFYSTETPFKSDFHRLARRLCGKSIGLVLGGGGARGISHVGVIRALEEAGIPIDIVGGTSIGAFIGALYARDVDIVPMYGRAKKFAGRMGSLWRFALDLTYPSASYTTGHEFNRGIFKTFGNSQIEDTWLDFYCNTTNISKSRCEYHKSGYIWRYVRASMSLAGLLPPLCDEGDMLLDGGYVDNLTVTHMKSLGADIIFAVDVGSMYDTIPQTYGDSLSGFWAFCNRFNPFSAHPNPPTLSEIQARLAYVSSISPLEAAKNMNGVMYMRPPIDPYGTLDFGKFDEIYEVGYKFGKEFIGQLKEKGILPWGVEGQEEGKEEGLRRTVPPRRASV
ncbi:MAG: phosphatidylcholine and lysophosphatidylcholine phospholipase [Cirrosporium novae-zelandiae]|nr:MAG: phosphatidylcholine and lysophosphatidylcholine phospholipase [Cirrosporium novae-zelandiae]